MSNKKKTILIALTLTLGVGVAGCGKGLINTNQNQNINANAESIDTSNWKIYKHEEYGFRFKHPKDWVIEESSKKIDFYNKEWALERDDFRKKLMSPEVSVSYYLNTNDVTALIKKIFNLEKYPTINEALKNEIDISDYRDEIINGKKISYILAGAELPYYSYFFPASNNKGIIIFEISYTNKLRSYLLSTISF